MSDLAPGYVSDMDKAVNTTKVDKQTIIGDITDYPIKDRILLEAFKGLFPKRLSLCR